MKLHTLLHGVALTDLPDTEITSVSSDTNNIAEGCLFVCIKGSKYDGHIVALKDDFKAAAVVCEKDLGLKNQIIVSNSRKAYSHICANWFARPDKKMKIIGVTGTNGKTTVTTVLHKVINDLGKKTGLIGTVKICIGEKILHNDRTTPESIELFGLLSEMADAGCEYVVMEVSSQALAQFRTGPIHYSAAVFTNLTQDHLDFHGSMENYYQAKKMIFSSCDFAVINADDEAGRRYFVELSCPKYTFSTEKTADYYADNIKLSSDKSTFWFSDSIKTYYTEFGMPGYFNVSNITAVLAVCDRLGFDLDKAIKAVADFGCVRGRTEVIPTNCDFKIICDYAHTPDAIEKVLSNLRETTKGRLVCLFGCGGNRDRTKRPLMAQAAAKYSDFVIVTSDNPRDEDPEEIIKEVIEGFKNTLTEYYTQADRKKAIFYAIKNARKNDIIVLAGKGHEDYQVLAGENKVHFDEREIVAEGLDLLGKGQL